MANELKENASSYFDMQFPVFSDGMSIDEKIDQIVNYLGIMKESIQYSLLPDETGNKQINAMENTMTLLKKEIAGSISELKTQSEEHAKKISILSNRTKTLGMWDGYLGSRDEWEDL